MKKTLFVSRYAPPSIGGAPQVMYTLMRSLPQEAYIMLTSFYNIDTTSAKVGTWLPGRYIFYDNIDASRDSVKHEPTAFEKKGRSFIYTLRHIAKQSRIIRNIIGIPIIFTQLYMIVKHGRRAVYKHTIDTIIGFSDYGPALIGAYIIHLLTRKPLKIYLFDVYKGSIYPFPGEQLAWLLEGRMMRRATQIIVTNKATADLYVKRYGESVADKLFVIHNPTPANRDQDTLAPYAPQSPYKIVFTGSVYWPQIGALQNLVEAINDTSIRLEIYSPTPESVLRHNGLLTENVDFRGAAPASDMPRVQGAADLLFLPLSWNTQSQVIIDTATPGKLADYLTAGRPMLIHAPQSSCIAQYGKENEFALVVDENDPVALRAQLTEFFAHPTERGTAYIHNARVFYNEHFDIEKNTELFNSILR